MDIPAAPRRYVGPARSAPVDVVAEDEQLPAFIRGDNDLGRRGRRGRGLCVRRRSCEKEFLFTKSLALTRNHL